MFVGSAVAVKRTPELQSVDNASLLGPSISFTLKRKSLAAIGVTPSASKKLNLILALLSGIPAIAEFDVNLISSPCWVKTPG